MTHRLPPDGDLRDIGADEFGLEEMRMFDCTRQAFSPDAKDALRVLEATQHALSVEVPPSAAAPPSTPAQVLLHAPGLSIRLVAATCLVALGVAVGFGLSHDVVGLSATPKSSAKIGPGATRHLPTPIDELTSTPDIVQANEFTPPESTVPRVETAVAPAPAAKTARAKPHRKGKREPTESPARRAAKQAALKPTSVDSLAYELARVRRVESALRAGHHYEALALLKELNWDVPKGQLMEERGAARAIANCSLGTENPSRLAATFAKAYPASVYLNRVQGQCAEQK